VSDDDKVRPLPVRFKKPPQEEGRSIKVVDTSFSKDQCGHIWRWHNYQLVNVTYLIRDGETEVECGECGTKLEPMWVLRQLANKESQWHRTRERYNEEMKRLSERSKTKCEACGFMTPISRTKPSRAS
jgi:hypothetical protein